MTITITLQIENESGVLSAPASVDIDVGAPVIFAASRALRVHKAELFADFCLFNGETPLDWNSVADSPNAQYRVRRLSQNRDIICYWGTALCEDAGASADINLSVLELLSKICNGLSRDASMSSNCFIIYRFINKGCAETAPIAGLSMAIVEDAVRNYPNKIIVFTLDALESRVERIGFPRCVFTFHDSSDHGRLQWIGKEVLKRTWRELADNLQEFPADVVVGRIVACGAGGVVNQIDWSSVEGLRHLALFASCGAREITPGSLNDKSSMYGYHFWRLAEAVPDLAALAMELQKAGVEVGTPRSTMTANMYQRKLDDFFGPGEMRVLRSAAEAGSLVVPVMKRSKSGSLGAVEDLGWAKGALESLVPAGEEITAFVRDSFEVIERICSDLWVWRWDDLLHEAKETEEWKKVDLFLDQIPEVSAFYLAEALAKLSERAPDALVGVVGELGNLLAKSGLTS